MMRILFLVALAGCSAATLPLEDDPPARVDLALDAVAPAAVDAVVVDSAKPPAICYPMGPASVSFCADCTGPGATPCPAICRGVAAPCIDPDPPQAILCVVACI